MQSNLKSSLICYAFKEKPNHVLLNCLPVLDAAVELEQVPVPEHADHGDGVQLERGDVGLVVGEDEGDAQLVQLVVDLLQLGHDLVAGVGPGAMLLPQYSMICVLSNLQVHFHKHILANYYLSFRHENFVDQP